MAPAVVTVLEECSGQAEHEIDLDSTSHARLDVCDDILSDRLVVGLDKSQGRDRQLSWNFAGSDQLQAKFAVVIDLDVGLALELEDAQGGDSMACFDRVVPLVSFQLLAE